MEQEIAKDSSWGIVRISDIIALVQNGEPKESFLDNEWLCPVCESPLSIKFWHKGEIKGGRKTHFFHKVKTPLTDHEPESELHRSTKEKIQILLKEDLIKKKLVWKIYDFESPRLEEVLCDGNSRADIYFSITLNDWEIKDYAIEVQYSSINPELFNQRHKEYQKNGIIDIWIWGVDFLGEKESSTPHRNDGLAKIKPKVILESVIEAFDSVLLVDLEWNVIVNLFSVPNQESRKIIHSEDIDRSGYMYYWKSYGLEWAFWKTTNAFVFERPNEENIDDHLESIEISYHSSPYIQAEFILVREPIDTIGYDYIWGGKSSFDLFKTVSESFYVAERDRLKSEKQEEIESDEQAKKILSQNGQLYVINALCALWMLLEKIFNEFWNYNNASKFQPFFTYRQDQKIRNLDIVSALNHIVKQIAYIRKSERNKDMWNYYWFDKFLRKYIYFLQQFIESDGIFADKSPTFTEFNKQVEAVSAWCLWDIWTEEYWALPFDFLREELKELDWDMDWFNLKREYWLPAILWALQSTPQWLNNVFNLIHSQSGKEILSKHVLLAEEIFAIEWLQEPSMRRYCA